MSDVLIWLEGASPARPRHTSLPGWQQPWQECCCTSHWLGLQCATIRIIIKFPVDAAPAPHPLLSISFYSVRPNCDETLGIIDTQAVNSLDYITAATFLLSNILCHSFYLQGKTVDITCSICESIQASLPTNEMVLAERLISTDDIRYTVTSSAPGRPDWSRFTLMVSAWLSSTRNVPW